jgi:DNA-binding PadR family transcriptional regulator
MGSAAKAPLEIRAGLGCRNLQRWAWRESSDGPPRRYYRLTTVGKEALDWFKGEWIRFRNGVDQVLEKGNQ